MIDRLVAAELSGQSEGRVAKIGVDARNSARARERNDSDEKSETEETDGMTNSSSSIIIALQHSEEQK